MNTKTFVDQLKTLGTFSEKVNIGPTQRLLSIIGGTYLLWSALSVLTSKKKAKVLNPAWNAITGSYLLYRGLSGHCTIKETVEHSENKIVAYLHHN